MGRKPVADNDVVHGKVDAFGNTETNSHEYENSEQHGNRCAERREKRKQNNDEHQAFPRAESGAERAQQHVGQPVPHVEDTPKFIT